MSRFLSLLALVVCAGVAGAQAKTEPLATQVKKSIHRGVEHLVKNQANWEVSKAGTGNRGGSTALVVLALLNCDGVLDDAALEQRRKQAIDNGLAFLRTLDPPEVYVRALQTMALAEARKPQDKNLIEQNALWLLKARVYRGGAFIGWDYRTGGSSSDASNSQYAMLGLWYARQYGVNIDAGVWKEIRAYYLRSKDANGSFAYSGDWGPSKSGPSRTMTVAGLCGLLIAGMEFPGGRETWQNGTVRDCGSYDENPAVARTLKAVSDQFKIDIGDYSYYHLYGLERAGRLSGLRFFGDHDWYREGCEFLTARQKADGSWPVLLFQEWPYTNSCFALLFLSRGRTPVVMSKLVHGKWQPPQGRNEADSDWNNDRNDLRHLTEYLSKENNPFDKKPPLAWQTYDISQALEARKGKDDNIRPEDEEAIVADMLQSPILYITGHKNPKLRIQDYETKLIQRYVENGGFLFAEACCGKKDFDDGIQDWVKNVGKAQLKFIDSTHPVWTCWNTITPGDPYKLMAVQVGCRTVMLYSPQDLSCQWESNRYGKGQPGQRAFELGCNIVAYATGRTAPLPRLTQVQLVDVKPPPEKERGSFRVSQLNHNSDDYQPAPKAMSNLVVHINKVTGLDVMVHTEKINLGDTSEWEDILKRKFFYMHGRKTIKPLDKDNKNLAALRFTLENGGLLFADACCGEETFDKSFRDFMTQLFPNDKLERVPFGENRDELFSEKLNKQALTAANIKCRTEKSGPVTPMEPYLEGIRVNGRWVVLYSKYDIGCALERHTSMDCRGYDADSAMRLATAVVLYNTRP